MSEAETTTGTSFKAPSESLPVPVDDGAADHLLGGEIPRLVLPSTLGGQRDLADVFACGGLAVIYVYPRTAVGQVRPVGGTVETDVGILTLYHRDDIRCGLAGSPLRYVQARVDRENQ